MVALSSCIFTDVADGGPRLVLLVGLRIAIARCGVLSHVWTRTVSPIGRCVTWARPREIALLSEVTVRPISSEYR